MSALFSNFTEMIYSWKTFFSDIVGVIVSNTSETTLKVIITLAVFAAIILGPYTIGALIAIIFSTNTLTTIGFGALWLVGLLSAAMATLGSIAIYFLIIEPLWGFLGEWVPSIRDKYEEN